MIWGRDKGGALSRVIIGLGNPGKEYEGTRHNAGFMAVDALAAALGVKMNKARFKAAAGEGALDGARLLLAKPMTFMNNSGDSAAEILRFYKLPPAALIVIYDDASLPVGKLRVRAAGSAGGHNGVKSLIARLHTDAFDRVKIGIGEKPERWDLADYVLSRFDKTEEAAMAEAAAKAADAAAHIVKHGAAAAMNAFNGQE